ncbi:MAG: hypothetical protein ACFB6R_06590 [Alphaproteobacteria bacterium]
MHLTKLAHVVYRQGCDVFNLCFKGATPGDLIDYTMKVLADPKLMALEEPDHV